MKACWHKALAWAFSAAEMTRAARDVLMLSANAHHRSAAMRKVFAPAQAGRCFGFPVKKNIAFEGDFRHEASSGSIFKGSQTAHGVRVVITSQRTCSDL